MISLRNLNESRFNYNHQTNFLFINEEDEKLREKAKNNQLQKFHIINGQTNNDYNEISKNKLSKLKTKVNSKILNDSKEANFIDLKKST